MIGRYLRLFRTVRHLKLSQVFYQVYYRLKPSRNLDEFLTSGSDLSFSPLQFKLQYSTPSAAGRDLSFTFLNLEHQFEKEVDWDYQGYGKLWNYNLQYFNFLQQADLADVEKQAMLHGIGEWLRLGRLKLEPYPVSLRIMNSIRYYCLNDVQDKRLINQTYAELSYLDEHLEFHIMGNHLLENVFALLMGAHAFNRPDWQKKAKRILRQELEEQVLNDGAHFELSPMYHQIILFRILELADWYGNLEKPDAAFLDFIKAKARVMLGWLQVMTFENGDIPHFSDSTTGIAFSSRELFQFANQLNINPAARVSLSDSGYRKYQVGNYECVIDAGAVGPSYQPGHSHADTLSFILYHRQSPLLVEAGTSTYQMGEKRAFERSTEAHNTVVVEGRNQSEVWGGFRVGSRASTEILNESDNLLEASHDGYLTAAGAMHKRQFYFDENRLKIKDFIQSNKKLKSKAYFHLHPDCNINFAENGLIILEGIGTIFLTNASHYQLETYQLSSGYNQYRTAQALVVDFSDTLETSFHFDS